MARSKENFFISPGSDEEKPALWHGFTDMRAFLKNTICITEGDGVWLRDSKGNTYLNAYSSLVNLSLGSSQKEIIDAIAEQGRRLPYFPIELGTHEIAETYAKRLIQKTPAGLDYVFYASTGSEANETIIKIIRQYQRYKHGDDTRKLEIIALDRGYHGMSFGALTATGTGFSLWRDQFAPLLPGFHHVPAPYAFQCKLGCEGVCNLACADAIRQKIQDIGPDRIGGIIVEPVLGVGGALVPPAEYHQRLRAICDEYDILLAYDEVITGFGRLGTWFGADYFGVVPDLMALSKGINSGYLPFAAVVTKQEIYDTFVGSESSYFANGTTTNGNPMCCASALATLDIMERDNLVEHAREMGDYLFSRFRALERYPIVGEIRGAGLLMVIELVSDRESRAPFPLDQWKVLTARLVRNGLIIGSSPAMMGVTYMSIAPPLTIERAEIDEIYTRLDRVLGRYAELAGSRRPARPGQQTTPAGA